MTSLDTTTGGVPDTGDIRAVHSGLRREFRIFPDLWLQASAEGDSGRAAALADHWTLITAFLHRHHEGEDELLWPLLRERAPEAGDLVVLMQQQHDEMLDVLAAADAVVAGAGATGPAPGTDLGPLHELAAAMAEHFDREEASVLPLCEAHLSAEEWDALGAHGRAAIPPGQMPIVACLILEDADETAAAAFVAPMPPPVRALATGDWQVAYEQYCATLRGT